MAGWCLTHHSSGTRQSAPLNSNVSGIHMKLGVSFLMLLISASLLAGEKRTMNTYQENITNRRNAEAAILWKAMEKDGFNESSIAALDFTFFSKDKNDAESLAKALSENYTATVSPTEQDDYWLIKGTTRPYGNEFNSSHWFGWVEFMVSMGFSNNCVFSTWSVYEPKSKKTWSSESIDVE